MATSCGKPQTVAGPTVGFRASGGRPPKGSCPLGRSQSNSPSVWLASRWLWTQRWTKRSSGP